MDRRVPLVLPLLLVLAGLAAPAVAMAAEPSLTATTVPGKEIDVAGSGFPADTDVVLVITHNGEDTTRPLRTDSAGSFTTVIDAGPGRGGRYAIVATAGEVKATAEVVAVETAGGAGGGPLGGGTSSPPATDAVGSGSDAARRPPSNGALLAIGAGVVGLLGIVTAGARGRRRRRNTDVVGDRR